MLIAAYIVSFSGLIILPVVLWIVFRMLTKFSETDAAIEQGAAAV